MNWVPNRSANTAMETPSWWFVMGGARSRRGANAWLNLVGFVRGLGL